MKALAGQGRAAVVTAVLLGTACAHEEAPPGHPPDFDPPVVVEMFPAYGSAMPDLDEDAYLRFDEPLGDPRGVSNLLVSSPAWAYEVRAGRSTVRIRPRDGWRRGVVYRFRISPGLRDMIRNVTREPIDLLFTTAGSLTATVAAGRVLDRETVRTVRDALVLVVGPDSVPYAAQTDTAGYFSLPSLPEGDYWAYGFRDQNRNRLLERESEAYDSALVSLPDSAATVDLELWLTAPDSTAPVLAEVEAADSLRLRLRFDDLLDPELDPGPVSLRVISEETAEALPMIGFVVGQGAAAPDAASDSVSMATQGGEEGEPDVMEARQRPENLLTVRLGRALTEGTYRVQVQGLPNLRGLLGGGDTTFVYVPPVPAAEATEDPAEAAEPAPGETDFPRSTDPGATDESEGTESQPRESP